MKSMQTIRHLQVTLCALLLGGMSLCAIAQTVGQVTHLSGTVVTKHADGSSKLLAVRSDVQQGDLLNTQDETYVRIKFIDGAEVVLRPNSQFKIESYAFNEGKPEQDNVVLSMLKGGLRAVTGLLGKRNKDKVSFTTPTATIGIRGTHFGALFCANDCGGVPTPSGSMLPNGLHVDVASGQIIVSNPGGSQIYNAGQFGFVPGPQSPPIIVPPSQGIQVTMPPNIAQNRGEGKGIGQDKTTECVAQ